MDAGRAVALGALSLNVVKLDVQALNRSWRRESAARDVSSALKEHARRGGANGPFVRAVARA